LGLDWKTDTYLRASPEAASRFLGLALGAGLVAMQDVCQPNLTTFHELAIHEHYIVAAFACQEFC
jgi:hypothetical protein